MLLGSVAAALAAPTRARPAYSESLIEGRAIDHVRHAVLRWHRALHLLLEELVDRLRRCRWSLDLWRRRHAQERERGL